MSTSDQVIIRQSQSDAPGVYISSDQQQQDTYGQAMTTQEQMAVMNGMGLAAASAPQPIQNPNVRVETQGQNITALLDGTVVYY
ncbi:hypothetical protein ACLM45_05775 [Synechococcus sp. A10-1-5-9]|uniref:hypothetical protein n=1 Tax=Synechococcus sp. A10-1-5-9 TaxID=3392295 RepID=UPI0039E8D2B9